MNAKESLERIIQEYLSGKSDVEADEVAISIIEKYGQEYFRVGVTAMRDVALREVEQYDPCDYVVDIQQAAEKLLTEGKKE